MKTFNVSSMKISNGVYTSDTNFSCQFLIPFSSFYQIYFLSSLLYPANTKLKKDKMLPIFPLFEEIPFSNGGHVSPTYVSS